MTSKNREIHKPTPSKKQKPDNDKLGMVFLSLLVLGIVILYIGATTQELEQFEMILNKMLRPIISV